MAVRAVVAAVVAMLALPAADAERAFAPRFATNTLGDMELRRAVTADGCERSRPDQRSAAS